MADNDLKTARSPRGQGESLGRQRLKNCTTSLREGRPFRAGMGMARSPSPRLGRLSRSESEGAHGTR